MKQKNIHVTYLWLVFATLSVGTAAWQVQVTANERVGGKRIAPLPAPVRTRHASREPAVSLDSNPLQAYRARLGKGLVEKEIDWILDDFRAVGLAQLPDTTEDATEVGDYLAYRRTQHRWYLDALAHALQLSPSQTAEAKDRLESLYQADAAVYQKMLDAIKPVTLDDGRSFLIGGAHDFNSILSAPSWIKGGDGGFLPGKLCKLTPEQEEILTGGGAEDLTEGFQSLENLLPFSNQLPADLLEDHPWDSESLAMVIGRFHPAQLKLLLLFDPSLSDRIDSAAWGYPENLPAREGLPESR